MCVCHECDAHTTKEGRGKETRQKREENSQLNPVLGRYLGGGERKAGRIEIGISFFLSFSFCDENALRQLLKRKKDSFSFSLSAH